jgi:hypothetical protein
MKLKRIINMSKSTKKEKSEKSKRIHKGSHVKKGKKQIHMEKQNKRK